MIGNVVLAGMQLEHPIMNAAGTCKVLEGDEGLIALVRSMTAAVVVGSITTEARLGNSGNVYFWNGDFSLNSLGLPNPGLPRYRELLPKMVERAHLYGKPLIASVAGFSPTAYAVLAAEAFELGADFVELNAGCPNVWDEGRQKSILSFNVAGIEATLQVVQNTVGVDAKVGIKLSPIFDPMLLESIAAVISRFPVVKAITTMNTVPNGFAFSNGQPAITPGGGLAGIAGPAVKPIGLGQVFQLRKLLSEHIDIIGVGGISSGEDVRAYLNIGATAVQIATAYLSRGPRVFDNILSELL